MSPHSSACVLCGHDVATEVRMAMVEWREPISKEIWSTVPRCIDRAACRQRVETVLREPWPVADGTPDSVIPPVGEPVLADVATSPDVAEEEEVVPWLR